MQKLFTDAETFQKERPTKITELQKQNFYKEMAEEIIKGGWSNDAAEKIMEDMAEISVHDTGYEIAKELEGFYMKASYNIDTEFIEFLDNFGYNKSQILQKNIQDWVAAHNPQPKLKEGQKLIIESPLNYKMGKGETVYINGFLEKDACYLIDKNPEKKGGTIIAYEKVERCCLIQN